MKISVITWDACFREKFHTLDSFCQQDYLSSDYEFLWVDFYENRNRELERKISKHGNCSLINLHSSTEVSWHLSKCLNKGVEMSKGEILVIADGDIVVDSQFLNLVEREIALNRDLVLYFRRWDESRDQHCEKSYSLDYLRENTELFNSTNYAGCIALRKENLITVGGYEEHDIFEGPGANSKELYLRLRNAGFAIKWHGRRIFHPWHESTGMSDKVFEELVELGKTHNWIVPYAGLEQSWVLRCRDIIVDRFTANAGEVETFLTTMPLADRRRRPRTRGLFGLKKFFGIALANHSL